MKKFLSDVLVDCNLTVSGTTSLGAATGITASAEDNSTALATTEWVTTHVSTNAIYSLRVPTGTTNIRLSSGGVTEDVTISATGAAAVSRVSDSEIRITSSNDVDYISDVSLSGSTLSFTGINNAFTGSLDLSALSAQLTDIETVYATVRNVSGIFIPKGTPLATVIGQTSGNVSDVVPADASDPAFMPALFVADEDIAEEAEGRAVAYGEIRGIDTSLYPSGTTVYVAPGGGWTDIKPTGTDLIQNLGVITKQHNTNGGGIVTGVGRSNDVPNIPQGYAWVGNANGVATPTLLGSLAYSSATYDNYGSWNLKTNGVQRTTVQSGGNLDIVAGTDISVSYGAGGVVTINSTATGSIDYISDVALNGNSLDFTAVGSGFAGSIDLSSLNAVSSIADLTDVDLTGLANNAILKYDSVNQEWVVSTTNDTANATATAIVPFAIASVNTTSNGSGIGISWSNWNSSNATLDFTFTTAQPNTDYIVITDTEIYDDFFVGVTNKTVNGFRAEFYDNSQSRTPSSFSEFSFIVYASDPTQQIKSSVGGINELSDVDTVTSTPSNGEALVWDGTNWAPGTISTTNNYLTGLSFNTSDGVLTATREGLGDLTEDLDGRYASSGHNHDSRYIRKDVVDSFTGLTNDVYDDTPGFLKGVISLRPGSEGGNTGIGFSTTVNVNTETGQDYGYLWWYDDNNNYAFGNGSGENAALILGIQNDSSTTSFGGTQDAVAIESSANIFFNPGLSGIGTGGVGGPDFTQGKVYIGRADEAYEVYHQGNLVNVSQLTNDAGYLTSFSETDPVFTAHVSSGITATKISNWDTAHGWGDHADEGYMLQPQWVQPITSGFGFHDDLGSGGDLNWAIGATDRGGVGQPGQNAFIIEKRTDGVEFTGLAQGTEVFTLDDSGNLGLSNSTPDHRLDVNGNIMTSGYLMVGNDTAVRIAKGSGTGNPVPQEVASFGSSVHIGAFIDFTIYNETKEHMRSGTMQLAFNADQVVFNEVSTMDIGDTTPCILNAVNNDGVVSVTFETPDPSFYIKYQVRTI